MSWANTLKVKWKRCRPLIGQIGLSLTQHAATKVAISSALWRRRFHTVSLFIKAISVSRLAVFSFFWNLRQPHTETQQHHPLPYPPTLPVLAFFFLTSWRLCHGCFTRHRYEGPQRITPTTRGYSLQRKTKSRKVPGAKSELFHAVETRIMCVSKLDWRIIKMFKIANAIVTVLELNYNHTDTPWWILLIV